MTCSVAVKVKIKMLNLHSDPTAYPPDYSLKTLKRRVGPKRALTKNRNAAIWQKALRKAKTSSKLPIALISVGTRREKKEISTALSWIELMVVRRSRRESGGDSSLLHFCRLSVTRWLRDDIYVILIKKFW